MRYVVHYQINQRLFTTDAYTLEAANMLAEHFRVHGFEGVTVSAEVCHG